MLQDEMIQKGAQIVDQEQQAFTGIHSLLESPGWLITETGIWVFTM